MNVDVHTAARRQRHVALVKRLHFVQHVAQDDVFVVELDGLRRPHGGP